MTFGRPLFTVLAVATVLTAGCTTAAYRAESKLTAGDRAALGAARQEALESTQTGNSTNWSNPDTGRRGTVTILETYQGSTGRPCREYQQTVTVEKTTLIAYGTACRREDGTWRTVDRTDFVSADRARRYSQYRYYNYPYHGGYPYYYRYHYPYYYPHRYWFYRSRFHFGFHHRV